MSDNHPKIPKSRLFKEYADGTADFRTTEQVDRFQKCTCHATGEWRFIMACVAECEWRKRAERWEKVWQHLHYRGHKVEFQGHDFYEPGSKRINFADNRISECKHYAALWRAWGMKK